MASAAGDIAGGAATGGMAGAAFGPIGAGIGIGVGAAAGVVGYLMESGEDDKAQQIIERAQQAYGSISLPALQKASLDVLGPTELAKITTNPAYQSAQMDALARLKVGIDQGGLMAQDRANLNRVQGQAAQAASARQGQIRENMAARGIGGSGAELAMDQASAQQEAQRDQQGGLDVAGMAQARALQMIKDRAGLAGQMQDREYAQKAAAAGAQDSINRFNLQHKFDVNAYNNGIAEQGYANQMERAQGMMGIANEQAGYEQQKGAREAKLMGTLGGAAGDVGMAGASPGGFGSYFGGNTGSPSPAQGATGGSAGGPSHYGQPNPYGYTPGYQDEYGTGDPRTHGDDVSHNPTDDPYYGY